MEATLSRINNQSLCPCFSLGKIKPSQKPHDGVGNFAVSSSSYVSYPKREMNYGFLGSVKPPADALVVARCRKLVAGPTAELEMELEAEMNEEISGEAWKGIGSWVEDCRGHGAVEMLECLEKEALMGEDLGKEPNDYNRRAHIFDKSSKVFQALKEKEHEAAPK